ncbi:MAG: hypothetical protein CMJ78_25750 [Planctomycetaceae bacterium]|nr:hypothetical protein [Planctomycetaceae bacterium]
MESRAKHPNKHIQEAIEHAQSQGWRLTKSGGQAHIWGTVWCPDASRDGCRFRIFSTPANPENHAKDLRRAIRRCQHA